MIRLGDIVQDNVLTPTSAHGTKGEGGFNEYQFTERYFEPQNYMVYLKFNPKNFEAYWRLAQSDGNLVFRKLAFSKNFLPITRGGWKSCPFPFPYTDHQLKEIV